MTANELEAATLPKGQPLPLPEFCDSAQLKALTGLGRSHAYELLAAGHIKGVSIRQPGAIRGKRLWHLPSVLAFLRSQMEGVQ